MKSSKKKHNHSTQNIRLFSNVIYERIVALLDFLIDVNFVILNLNL